MDRGKLPNIRKSKSPSFKVYYTPFGIRTYHNRHHKRKKDKYIVHRSFREGHTSSALMSGDSQSSQKHELFEFKEKPQSPNESNETGAKILKFDVAATSAISEKVNNLRDSQNHDDDLLTTAEDVPLRDSAKKQKLDDKYTSVNDSKKQNETTNKLIKNKQIDKEDEESCGIKCLYYTLQCCECTIM